MSRLIPAPQLGTIKIYSAGEELDFVVLSHPDLSFDSFSPGPIGDYEVEVNMFLTDTVDSLGVNTQLFQFVKGEAADFGEGRSAPDLTDYIKLRIVQSLSPVATDYLIANPALVPSFGTGTFEGASVISGIYSALTDSEPSPDDYEMGEDSPQYQSAHNTWQAQYDQVTEGNWYEVQDISLNQNLFNSIDKFYDQVLSDGIDAPGPGRNKTYRVPYRAEFEIDGEYMEGHIAYFAVCYIDMQQVARDFGLGPAAMASSLFEIIYGTGAYMVALDNYTASAGVIDESAAIESIGMFMADNAYDADDCSHFKMYLTSTESYTDEMSGAGVEIVTDDGGGATTDSYGYTYNGLHMRGVVFFDLLRMARFESAMGFMLANESFRQTVIDEELIELQKIEIYRLSSEGGGAPGEFPLTEALYATMTYDDGELESATYYPHEGLYTASSDFASQGDASGFVEEIGEFLGFSTGNHYPMEVISFLDIGKDIAANTVRNTIPVRTSGIDLFTEAQYNNGCSDFLQTTEQSIEYKICVTFKDEMSQFLIDLYDDLGLQMKILERYYHDSLLPCHYHEYTDEFNEIFIEFIQVNYGSGFLGSTGDLSQIVLDFITLQKYFIDWGFLTGDLSTAHSDWMIKVDASYTTASPQYILDFIKHAEALLKILKDIIDTTGLLDDFTSYLEDPATDISSAFTNEIEVCCTFDNDAYTYTEDDGTIDPFYGSMERASWESYTEDDEIATTVVQGYDMEGNPVD